MTTETVTFGKKLAAIIIGLALICWVAFLLPFVIIAILIRAAW